eukprot:g13349.t1
MEESRKAGVLRTVDSASAGLRYVFSLLMGNTQIDEFSGKEVEKLKFVNELRDDVLRNCKEAKFPPEVPQHVYESLLEKLQSIIISYGATSTWGLTTSKAPRRDKQEDLLPLLTAGNGVEELKALAFGFEGELRKLAGRNDPFDDARAADAELLSPTNDDEFTARRKLLRGVRTMLELTATQETNLQTQYNSLFDAKRKLGRSLTKNVNKKHRKKWNERNIFGQQTQSVVLFGTIPASEEEELVRVFDRLAKYHGLSLSEKYQVRKLYEELVSEAASGLAAKGAQMKLEGKSGSTNGKGKPSYGRFTYAFGTTTSTSTTTSTNSLVEDVEGEEELARYEQEAWAALERFWDDDEMEDDDLDDDAEVEEDRPLVPLEPQPSCPAFGWDPAAAAVVARIKDLLGDRCQGSVGGDEQLARKTRNLESDRAATAEDDSFHRSHNNSALENTSSRSDADASSGEDDDDGVHQALPPPHAPRLHELAREVASYLQTKAHGQLAEEKDLQYPSLLHNLEDYVRYFVPNLERDYLLNKLRLGLRLGLRTADERHKNVKFRNDEEEGEGDGMSAKSANADALSPLEQFLFGPEGEITTDSGGLVPPGARLRRFLDKWEENMTGNEEKENQGDAGGDKDGEKMMVVDVEKVNGTNTTAANITSGTKEELVYFLQLQPNLVKRFLKRNGGRKYIAKAVCDSHDVPAIYKNQHSIEHLIAIAAVSIAARERSYAKVKSRDLELTEESGDKASWYQYVNLHYHPTFAGIHRSGLRNPENFFKVSKFFFEGREAFEAARAKNEKKLAAEREKMNASEEQQASSGLLARIFSSMWYDAPAPATVTSFYDKLGYECDPKEEGGVVGASAEFIEQERGDGEGVRSSPPVTRCGWGRGGVAQRRSAGAAAQSLESVAKLLTHKRKLQKAFDEHFEGQVSGVAGGGVVGNRMRLSPRYMLLMPVTSAYAK